MVMSSLLTILLLGRTHLPDVTVVVPVFSEKQLRAFVVNRAHHEDIEVSTPCSIPLSRSLKEKGIIISPSYLKKT